MPKIKKIPQRMCVGCQEMKPKKQLIRVVRTPDDLVVIDSTGKKSGRGAYICPDLDCLTKALKGKRFDKALQRTISQGLVEDLKKGLVKNE
ncbi:MAG: YlxR family protein [Desulfotomaculaceae bacterium]|nr:YlxR family protein [Desulfotomaculaceae bacterium]